jgi:hypothetical protein
MFTYYRLSPLPVSRQKDKISHLPIFADAAGQPKILKTLQDLFSRIFDDTDLIKMTFRLLKRFTIF